MFKILNTFRHAFNMVLYIFGEQLYSGLVMTMTSYLSEISKLIQDAQGELLLEELNWKWADYKKALETIRDVMMYMEKTFIPSTHKTPIRELVAMSFPRLGFRIHFLSCSSRKEWW